MPFDLGDVVSTYLRPAERFTIVGTDRYMVQLRSIDGGEFWCARSVLTRIES